MMLLLTIILIKLQMQTITLFKIEGVFILRAQGASFHNGFGFQLPFDKANIENVSGDLFGDWAESNGDLYNDWWKNENGYRNASNIYVPLIEDMEKEVFSCRH